MVELMENKTGLLERHAPLIETRRNGGQWLREIREHALERFGSLGYPTQRDEEWKFTNVSPIAKTHFELPQERARLTPEQVRQFAIPNLAPVAQLIFVNGHFDASLSSSKSLPKGVRVMPLVEAFESNRAAIEPHLTGHSLHAEKADGFTWLNTALVEDGVFVHVAKGVALPQPIELLSIFLPGPRPLMQHPRNIIIGDENSEFTVVERYVAIGGDHYFTNAVTDVMAGEHARINHYLIEEEGAGGYNVSTLRTRQLRRSNVASHTILLGGKLVRNNIHAILDGEGTECLINGLFIGSDSQHMDNHMRVEHAKPHGDSRQFYKGILNGHATGVFSGRIIVHPGAQKTDAKQTNKNLLLSREAHVDTKPQLEIYADDVKCTHGATIGQLDEQAIMYCRARGISTDAARSMLIHAFAAESLDRMKNAAIREYLDNILIARLPGGDLLERWIET
jgi:Fe-S cluster assembly protein SufD